MKKIYLLFASLIVGGAAWSQQLTEIDFVKYSTSKEAITDVSAASGDPTDTLGFDEFGNGLYAFGSTAGWISGTSSMTNGGQTQQNHEFAAGYEVSGSYDVLGAFILFASKAESSGTPADLKVHVRPIEPLSAVSAIGVSSLDTAGPGEPLTSQALPFNSIENGQGIPIPTITMFDQTAAVSDDFVIGVDIEDSYGSTPIDSIVLFTDSIGDSDGMLTWTRFGIENPSGAASTWYKTTGTIQGGFNVHFAIFAIVSSVVGIEEQGYLNGVKMSAFPNPAISSDDVTIQYALETTAKNIDINIYSLNGQQVYTATLANKAAGLYNVNVPAGTLAAGSYVYSIDADGARMAKRMEILK